MLIENAPHILKPLSENTFKRFFLISLLSGKTPKCGNTFVANKTKIYELIYLYPEIDNTLYFTIVRGVYLISRKPVKYLENNFFSTLIGKETL